MPKINYKKLNSNTYTKVANDDSKYFLEVEIGDIKQEEFFPQIKIKKWDNEVNASFRLIDDFTGTVRKDGEIIKYEKPEKDIAFYQTEDEKAFEFDITLKEKPVSNKIQFTIQQKGLEFYYQPALRAVLPVRLLHPLRAVAPLPRPAVVPVRRQVLPLLFLLATLIRIFRHHMILASLV